MAISPLDLFKIAEEVNEEKASINKYTYLAWKFKFPHYKILNLRQVMLNGLHLSMPKYLLDFISEQGEVLLIANIIEGFIPLVQLRSLHGEKKFSVLGSQSKLFYGLGYLDKNFKYGDWIVIVEGIADADLCRGLYPNVLATMTSRITKSQFEVLKLLTNNIILIGDNDIPGKKGTKANKQLIQKEGMNARIIFQYGNFKDIGELGDLLLANDGYTFNVATQYYKTKIHEIIGR